MITHVVPERGSRTRGLVDYLWGPGKANEHEDPHVVAAWDHSFVRSTGDHVFDAFERGMLAREMDAPMRMFGLPPGGHVYHVAVSVRSDDGLLTDDQWAVVAQEAAEKLGFTEAVGRAAAPWFAMRHGPSVNGHDHIHFVAMLHRESGERVRLKNDYHVWAEVRHNAEERWNLTRTGGRGTGIPDQRRGEIERARREGKTETHRQTLARIVRGCGAAATNEADFVTRLRRNGVRVSPRWEAGGTTHAVGYSVGLPPEEGSKIVWYGGGKLARDLSLTSLRTQWETPTEDAAADILRAWRPPGWRDLPRGRDVQRAHARAEAWDDATRVTSEIRTALSTLNPRDTGAWSAVSADAAAALSALAQRVEVRHRPELRRAADALARSAQTSRQEPPRVRPDQAAPFTTVVRTAADAALAANGGPYAVAALIMQLGRLVQAIQRANEANGRAVQAMRNREAAEAMLHYVRSTPPPSGHEALERSGGDRPRQAREISAAEGYQDRQRAAAPNDKGRAER